MIQCLLSRKFTESFMWVLEVRTRLSLSPSIWELLQAKCIYGGVEMPNNCRSIKPAGGRSQGFGKGGSTIWGSGTLWERSLRGWGANTMTACWDKGVSTQIRGQTWHHMACGFRVAIGTRWPAVRCGWKHQSNFAIIKDKSSDQRVHQRRCCSKVI